MKLSKPLVASAYLAALTWVVFPSRAAAGDPPSGTSRKTVTPKTRESPDDMIEMEVRDVLDIHDGSAHAVILTPKGTDTLVPIFIGDSEALAIALRLHRQSAPRPLTHDLLEKVIHTLGARVTKIYIDDMRDSVYFGRVFLEYGDKSFELDARPSDSIALAVGSHAPIFASRKVVDLAGINRKELERNAEGPERGSKTNGEDRDDTL
jgi:uncharacterized protein